MIPDSPPPSDGGSPVEDKPILGDESKNKIYENENLRCAIHRLLLVFIHQGKKQNYMVWTGGGAKKLFNEINEIITYRRKNLHGGDEDSSF